MYWFFFAGIVCLYTLLQIAMWWLFHTSALLWKVKFPLHARSYDNAGKTKYIHMACVIVGVVVPLLPIVALMADYALEVQSNAVLQAANVTFMSGGLGFTLSRFPPIFCHGTSSVMFYGLALPLILIFFVGITELVLLFAVVHKVSK